MNCPNCNYENKTVATFCGSCGKRIEVIQEIDYKIPLRKISILFFTLLSYIIIIHFTSLGDNYETLLLADLLFGFIVIVFFFTNRKTSIRYFRPGNFSIKMMVLIFFAAPLMAIAVNSFADFLNKSVFDQAETIYYLHFKDSPFPLFLSILSIGIFPAIFEEIAFRGILFDESIKILDTKAAILVTSVLFTILHLSVISSLWIFPFGILLGYLRARYNTILYGMAAHFIYNTTIILIEANFLYKF